MGRSGSSGESLIFTLSLSLSYSLHVLVLCGRLNELIQGVPKADTKEQVRNPLHRHRVSLRLYLHAQRVKKSFFYL